MPDGLRARIEAAIEPIASWVEVDYASVTTGASLTADLVDAVMLVVDEALHRASHTDRGRCSYCRVIVSEVLLYGDPKPPLPPHKMSCRFYVGPVEHRVVGGAPSLTHWATRCSCGRSYDVEDGGCPNAEEDWRGAPEERP
jgi:hypothetical protein